MSYIYIYIYETLQIDENMEPSVLISIQSFIHPAVIFQPELNPKAFW